MTKKTAMVEVAVPSSLAKRSLQADNKPVRQPLSQEALLFLKECLSNPSKSRSVDCVCGFTEDQFLLPRDRYGLPIQTVFCQGCGLIRTAVQLSDSRIAEFYARHYRPLYLGTAGVTQEFFEDQELRGYQLLHSLQSLLTPGSSVVDLGCGAGGLLVPFLEAGFGAIGFDYDVSYLGAGRERGLDLREAPLNRGDLEKPPGLIVLSHVLEHVSNPIAFLKESVVPHCDADTLVYVEVPGLLNIPYSYRDPLDYFHVAHTWAFSLRTLQFVASSAGLQLVRGDEHIRALLQVAKPMGRRPDTVASASAISLTLRVAEGRMAPRAELYL